MRATRRTIVAALVLAVSLLGFAAPASACTGPVCDQLNVVCEKVFKDPCVR